MIINKLLVVKIETCFAFSYASQMEMILHLLDIKTKYYKIFQEHG